jgi:hypothetical protein
MNPNIDSKEKIKSLINSITDIHKKEELLLKLNKKSELYINSRILFIQNSIIRLKKESQE